MDIERFTPKMVHQNDSGYRYTPIFHSGQYYFPGISPDERYLSLYKTNSNFDSAYKLLNSHLKSINIGNQYKNTHAQEGGGGKTAIVRNNNDEYIHKQHKNDFRNGQVLMFHFPHSNQPCNPNTMHGH